MLIRPRAANLTNSESFTTRPAHQFVGTAPHFLSRPSTAADFKRMTFFYLFFTFVTCPPPVFVCVALLMNVHHDRSGIDIRFAYYSKLLVLPLCLLFCFTFVPVCLLSLVFLSPDLGSPLSPCLLPFLLSPLALHPSPSCVLRLCLPLSVPCLCTACHLSNHCLLRLLPRLSLISSPHPPFCLPPLLPPTPQASPRPPPP